MPSNCRPGRPPKRGVPPFPAPQHTILHFKPPGLVSGEPHLAGYTPPHHQHHHLQHVPVTPTAAQMMAQVRPSC